MKKAWTEDDKQKTKELWSQGKSQSEIGLIIGRSRNSIARLIHTYREEFERRQKPVDRDKIKELEAAGHSAKEIQQLTGYANDTVLNTIDESSKNRRSLMTITTREKPTPENTVIQYEFTEHAMPENALNTPFFCLEVGQCHWVSGGFWDEVKYDTPCCGLSVVDRLDKGMKRSYCQFHYEVALRKEENAE